MDKFLFCSTGRESKNSFTCDIIIVCFRCSALPACWMVGIEGTVDRGEGSIFISALDMLSRHFSPSKLVINISASSFRLR